MLFALGKTNLGVPMTFKMIYPYIENFELFKNLIPISTLIIVIIVYVLIFGFLVYFWNKAFPSIAKYRIAILNRRSIVFISATLVLLFVLITKVPYFKEKLDGHKINEPYLTFLFFDEAFDRQKDKGDKNALEFRNYSSPKGNGKNVILIIADALRPDFFQSDEQLTPFVDSLLTASNFVAHQNMYATASFSYNGISSILSSSKELYEQNFFLHDVLKKQGYQINFILSGDMTNFWNLKGHITTESVDFYTDGYESFKYGRSESLNDDQKNILDQLTDLEPYNGAPTFFYFHMMSVHQIGDLKTKYKRFQPSTIDLSSRDFSSELLVNDYKNRMVQLDDYIRKLYEILEEKGYLENFVFVVTADHGQSLGENGIYFHSKYINYESIKIPFIVNYDTIKDTHQVASQLDIAPTILEALNLKKPKTWEGSSIGRDVEQTIFQNQGDYYSMIWKQNEVTFQLWYDRANNEMKMFNISPNSNKYENIISNWQPKTLDSLKNILTSHYKVK